MIHGTNDSSIIASIRTRNHKKYDDKRSTPTIVWNNKDCIRSAFTIFEIEKSLLIGGVYCPIFLKALPTSHCKFIVV
jgi:hypothetical protein